MNLQPSALETDALPLSYSPKELDDLAALRCGYSSAVLKEADVYPKAWNVARVFRKNRRRVIATLFVITIGGCWHSPPSPPAPPANAAPVRAHSPVLPDVAGGELGTWDVDGTFHPTFDIPLYAGSVFGWRLDLPCTTRMIEVDEELRLPAAGDWGEDPEMEISADGRTARIHYMAECHGGWIEKQWSVSAGDPPGVWAIRVTARGFAPKKLRAMFTRDLLAPAPTSP